MPQEDAQYAQSSSIIFLYLTVIRPALSNAGQNLLEITENVEMDDGNKED